MAQLSQIWASFVEGGMQKTAAFFLSHLRGASCDSLFAPKLSCELSLFFSSFVSFSGMHGIFLERVGAPAR